MTGWRIGAVAFAVLVNATRGLGDDDAPAPPRRPAARPQVTEPGIDLAAHVDLNVMLRDDEWRIGGGRHVVIGRHGPVVFDGNLTISGGPVEEPAERIRHADESVLVRLRQAQRVALGSLAADLREPTARRRALELATEADIRRVAGDVSRLRERYAGRRANLGDEQWQAFQRDMRRCRRAIADPFGADSLFAAVRAGFTTADADP